MKLSLCRTIYGLVASQVGDFHNEMSLLTGGTSTPANFILSSYGYRHDYLGKQKKQAAFLNSGPSTSCCPEQSDQDILKAYIAFIDGGESPCREDCGNKLQLAHLPLCRQLSLLQVRSLISHFIIPCNTCLCIGLGLDSD